MTQVDMCWQLENCEALIQDGEKTVWKRFLSSLDKPCCCAGEWAVAAREIVVNNELNEKNLCADIRKALLVGLKKKGDVVAFAGWGNEGKSFLVKPLQLIYDQVPSLVPSYFRLLHFQHGEVMSH